MRRKTDRVDFQQVLDHFGGEYELGAALKISRQAVNAWCGIIPELRAHQIEKLTDGLFKFDELPT